MNVHAHAAPSHARAARAGAPPVGALLRRWREQRRLSQMALALEAEVSTRHLSGVETGRAQPSRELLLRLAEPLDLPLRERNALLLAAGFAPLYAEPAEGAPLPEAVRRAVDLVLAGHRPYPALAVDRHWHIVAHNDALAPLLQGVAPHLLAPPANALRISLHPEGLAPRIANLGYWRHHVLTRLARQVDASGDAVLAALARELAAYPVADAGDDGPDWGGVAVPLRLRVGEGRVLNLLSTTTVFGTPVDVTLAELALETFFPANEATAAFFRGG